MPVSGAGPLTMRARRQQAAVTGPASMPNGRSALTGPPGPVVRGTSRGDVSPSLPAASPEVLSAPPPYAGGSPAGYQAIPPPG